MPLTQRVGSERRQLRASLLAPRIVGIEPPASVSREQVVHAITPVFEHYLYGDRVDLEATGQTASGSPS